MALKPIYFIPALIESQNLASSTGTRYKQALARSKINLDGMGLPLCETTPVVVVAMLHLPLVITVLINSIKCVSI